MSLMLVRRKESQGVWVRETVCLGILVNPSELCKYMNVCGGGGLGVGVCVCVYKERTAEWVRLRERLGSRRESNTIRGYFWQYRGLKILTQPKC